VADRLRRRRHDDTKRSAARCPLCGHRSPIPGDPPRNVRCADIARACGPRCPWGGHPGTRTSSRSSASAWSPSGAASSDRFARRRARAADISHRNEDDPAGRRPGRIPKPGETRSTVHRKRGTECLGVAPDSISCRRRVRDDQTPGDTATRPASLSGNPRREPALSIERHHRSIRVADRGLDLDHREPASSRVTTDDVDRSTLTVDRERYLDLRLPARHPEQPDSSGDRHRMLLIDQPVEAFATPAKVQLEASAQRIANGHEVRPGDPLDLARSIRPTTLRESPARAARSTCRQPSRRRSARIARPNRHRSIRAS
jgi:hypothetical protein